MPQTTSLSKPYLTPSRNLDPSSMEIGLHLYSFDYIIGKGGFGKVWKAYEKSTNKVVANKKMNKRRII